MTALSTGELRLLFHISNRRGLGHFMRGLNISREILSLAPQTKITFSVPGEPPESLCQPSIQIIRMPNESCSTFCFEQWKEMKPHVIVFDTMLPKLPDRKLWNHVSLAYIMRRCQSVRQQQVFSDPILSEFDQILVPHSRDEFGFDVPDFLASKTTFVGPIVRLPSTPMRELLREKYKLHGEAPLLVSTPGGGGFAEESRYFIDAVCQAHRQLLQQDVHFQHLVITGPNCRETVEKLPGMRVIACEPELVSLLAEADLVVSAGGYNTVNEIRMTCTPAVFLPSPRRHDDQFERVQSLAQRGLAFVIANQPTECAGRGIAEYFRSPELLKTLRNRAVLERPLPGNRLAAKLLLQLASQC